MSRAEEKALKAYPNIKIGEQHIDQSPAREVYVQGYEQAEKDFTHIEPNDDCKQAAVHYMEDCQEVDDFVRRGIDDIAERYFCKGAEWEENNLMDMAEKWLKDNAHIFGYAECTDAFDAHYIYDADKLVESFKQAMSELK